MTKRRLTTIGFDADDTLWQNEQFYRMTEARFAELLGEHLDAPGVSARLLGAAQRNLGVYGFGIKSFMLSMIETAIEVTNGEVGGEVIGRILQIGREMLKHPIETLPDARETVEALKERYLIVLVTKGDLIDQERKLAQSGLGELFDGVEIVSDKSADTYRRVFARHGEGAERAMMIGNSLKSDVLPALAAGAWGVFVPHELTWAAEHAEEPAGHPRFRKIARLAELADVIAEIEAS
jgi:putative hydrolase of the HAD superfamily